MKKLIMVLLVGCILLILTSCSQESPTNDIVEIEPPPVEFVPEIEVEPEPEPEIILPFTLALTGEGSETEIKDRPVMVMVENQKSARPQSGLHEADIVYEILAEGDITRFVAIYQSKTPEIIGPVRSIRDYFIRIGDGLDAIIVHAGWSPEAKEMLTGQGRPNLNELIGGDYKYYWRSDERKAPHNLYTSIEKIRQGAADKKFRTDSKELKLKFAAKDAEFTGDSAEKVTIHYIRGYRVSYEYDAEKGYYNRNMAGEAHLDKETETQLIAHNIIVAESSHKVIDSVGRRDVNVAGPGNGYLIQKGKAQKVTWETKDGLVRAFIDGKELQLVPGKTWIQIVPIGSQIDIE